MAGLGADQAATVDPLSQNWEQWEPSATLLYAEPESTFRVWDLHAWEDSQDTSDHSAQEKLSHGQAKPYSTILG